MGERECVGVANLNKKKRVFDEVSEGGDSYGKKFKNLMRENREFGDIQMGFKGGGEIDLNPKEGSCSGGGGSRSFEEKRSSFDLNLSVIDIDDDDDDEPVPVPFVSDREGEIIHIPEDDKEDGIIHIPEDHKEDGIIHIPEDHKEDGIINIPSDDSDDEMVYANVIQEFDLVGLDLMESCFGGTSYGSGVQRYSRDEKGKGKVDDSWLSLTTSSTEIAFQLENQDFMGFNAQPAEQELFQFGAVPEMQDTIDFGGFGVLDPSFDLQLGYQGPFEFDHLLEAADQVERPDRSIEEELERARLELGRAQVYLDIERDKQLDLQRRARRFARTDDYGEGSSSQEKVSPEIGSLLGKCPGPFSDALQMVRDRKSKKKEPLLAWQPVANGFDRSRPNHVPSLLDLSIKVLADNADAIVSLNLVPDFLRRRLADIICNRRGMSAHTFKLFFEGSPTQIQIKDSSWLAQDQFLKTFRNFDTRGLTVLQLELCGQCILDDHVISENLAWSSKSFPNLRVLSLKGACRLTDEGLKAIVTSAPLLKSLNLSQCSLLSNDGIRILADSLGSMLRELYIDDCQKLDPMLILPSLKKFEYMETLSVAGIQTVSDQFMIGLISVCGKNLKDLDLGDCMGLTDSSLRIIGDTCTGLRSLNLSDLDKLSDLGLQYLANGCRYMEALKMCRNNFSDEAVAAYLEASGSYLKELSLNNVTSVGPSTAFSLANFSNKLLHLDLSWCRNITDEALGLIVDRCSSLKSIKLFGCTQISHEFLNGHSNRQVKIIGLQLTKILESGNLPLEGV